MRDPYQVLGVPKSATQAEIKTAYRRLARTLHPDINPNDKRAEERFKEVTAAYDLLGDAAKRERYDRGEIDATGAERHRGYRSSASAGASAGARGAGFKSGSKFSAEDIMEELFRRRDRARSGAGAGSTRSGTGGSFKVHGSDTSYTLRVSFEEAAQGVTKRITLSTGKSLDVKIPAGTKDGTTLRLKGQGQAGAGGGNPGDALIEVRVEDHGWFQREGRDIRMDLPVSLPEAVLGGKVTVPTLAGKVAVTIPPGSNTGTVLRLKGKGMAEGGEAGDQLITLKVVLPDRPNAELEDFLRRWAEKNAYDPRK